MSLTVIILLLIIVILLVILMYYYFQKTTQSLLNLNTSNPPIVNKDMSNPSSVRFSYKLWVYVNSWDNTQQKNIILANVGNRPPNNFSLYLDATSPTLHCSIQSQDNNQNDIIITTNCPIQSWVYIVVSVDNQVVDCYLDGKMVKSTQLLSMPNVSNSYDINFGVCDAYVVKFQRVPTPTDPQTVWNDYLSGNGYSSSISSYGLSVAITKDNTPIAQYSY